MIMQLLKRTKRRDTKKNHSPVYLHLNPCPCANSIKARPALQVEKKAKMNETLISM